MTEVSGTSFSIFTILKTSRMGFEPINPEGNRISNPAQYQVVPPWHYRVSIFILYIKFFVSFIKNIYFLWRYSGVGQSGVPGGLITPRSVEVAGKTTTEFKSTLRYFFFPYFSIFRSQLSKFFSPFSTLYYTIIL